ncbi:DNA damage-regulated autophagy modulator protein 1-like [Oppia nitens]|uniref:DNA damage-regulated autophagy modulator protein 1-like n=1 Tax=Oppia nitens TaxID=1686743 RepID=UPI0023DA238D|nr:DNA damage-regulated autophagy modulator protein 1-like [Oppia nitens]
MVINIVFGPFILWSISVYLGHIEPLLPYVSDLGVTPPEASLFSLMMNFGAFLLMLFTLIRYESIKTHQLFDVNPNDNIKNSVRKVNNWSLVSGICMSIGFGIVANFRNAESPVIQFVHNLGAVLGFLSTVCDMGLQSRAAFNMRDRSTGRFRCGLCTIALVLAVAYNALSIWSFLVYPEALKDKNVRLMWNSSQPGYVPHVMSTVLEWILIFMISPYILTFVSLFKRYSISKPIIVNKDNTIESIKIGDNQN